ncbi:MAG: nucleotide-binding protein [Candidatus Thorarchaeota archaeon]|nr:nucleotide-binding protein [Candidatus Thorarchaeota archaeon]
MPLVVVLDTNILTVPAQFGVDIFSEAERILERNVEFIVLDSVVVELERNLKTVTGKEESWFKIALDLVERCKVVKTVDTQQSVPVDERILQYAKSSKGVIATNDKGLKERAISQGTPVLYLRSKKRLQLIGFTA